MSTGPSPRAVRELGRTESSAETRSLLIARQHTQRLLLLRALVDALFATPPSAVPSGALALARRHWSLLEAADLADSQAARQVLFYPLVGPWAEGCVRQLAADRPRPVAPRVVGLEHLGALAVAAAARAGLPFTAPLTVRAGRLVLPTLGALRCATSETVTALGRGGAGRLTLRVAGQPPVELRRGREGDWCSADPRWVPIPSLPGAPGPVLLDDLDPTRRLDGDLERHGVRATDTLRSSERDHWLACWDQALSLLRLSGGARWDELALLRCIVPLSHRGQHTASPAVTAYSSGTRGEAFGAVFASAPPTPALLAACLVHEFQHAKLAALSELTPLHTAGRERCYWAPWRTDPRPFDGLLHGAYAHLALADHWRRLAQARTASVHHDQAWAEYSRCREQVGAVLPALLGSARLTWLGRVFVTEMSALHARLARHPPPERHRARAVASVESARVMWRGQHAG